MFASLFAVFAVSSTFLYSVLPEMCVFMFRSATFRSTDPVAFSEQTCTTFPFVPGSFGGDSDFGERRRATAQVVCILHAELQCMLRTEAARRLRAEGRSGAAAHGGSRPEQKA